MLRGCAQGLDKLSKSFAQVLDLSAVSTGRFFGEILYPNLPTTMAHNFDGFAQPKNWFSNLLSAGLCSVSTGPITNTKLI